MNTAKRWLANSIMLLAVVCGAGAVALFAAVPAGSLRLLPVQWPEAGLLGWDALLSFAFFLQHSGMVRRGFRDRIAGVVPPAYHRAVYSIASGVVLTAVVLLWQPTGNHLLVLAGPARRLAQGGAVMAVAVFVWSVCALRSVDLFGLAPLRAYVHGSAEKPPAFVARGPYRWVRHPFYFCAILLIWSYPDLTSDRLLFNVLWTAWVSIGARLEERDLRSDFGGAYESYRRQVPMLVPWRGPMAV